MTQEERESRVRALREEYPQWTGGPFSDQGVDDVIFLLSEVDRLSQELDSAKTERGLAFVEVSAWRQKDDSEKRITKERDAALAQVAQLRRALLALATWMEANDDLSERGLSKGAREDLDKALIAIESTGPKP